MFGFNYPGQATDEVQNYNSNDMVIPLRGEQNLTTEQWFAHGVKDYPPAAGEFMDLPAGGSIVLELGCNRALTSYRDPRVTKELPYYACDVSRSIR
jgi:hypothetical protein